MSICSPLPTSNLGGAFKRKLGNNLETGETTKFSTEIGKDKKKEKNSDLYRSFEVV
jgi:hypothetical protein